jgi:hypothetical protein
LDRPPLWALLLAAAGVIVLGVGTPIALERGQVQATTPRPTPSAGASSSAAAFTPPTGGTLFDDFTGRGGEQLTPAETGQKWTRTGDARLILTDSGMTLRGTGAGYTWTVLGETPDSFGATVVFQPGKSGAVAALLISAGPTELDLGNMGVHYYAGTEGWTIQVREGGELPFPTLDSGSYSLVADGRTEYHIDIAINGDTVTITNPDGSTAAVTDPRIGANVSGVVAWEVYRDDAAEARPVFRKVWAQAG